MTETLRLGSLPSVAAARARATRAPGLWTYATQSAATFRLAGLGLVHLTCDGFEEAGSTSHEELVLVGRDGRRGRVAVDRWFALTLVAATLGSRAPRVVRALGRAERGVLAGHVAASLAQRGCEVTVSLDDPRFSDDARTVSLALRVETSDIAGRAHVDIPLEWLTSSWERLLAQSAPHAETFRRAIGRLPIGLSIELATTEMAVGDWSRARPADAVVFTGSPFLTTSEWPVSLRVGDHAADAILTRQGTLSVVAPFLEVSPRALLVPKAGATARAPNAKEPGVMSDQPDDQTSTQTLNAIRAAPIEIVAEVGRVTLRAEEILGLHRGSVLALGHQGQVVNLLVGGRPWAKGELVNVDGELGVRITELTPG